MRADKIIWGFVLFFVLLFLAPAYSGAEIARIQDIPFETTSPEFKEPFEVIQSFLNAVDRGELTLYGLTIEQSMLEPKLVEYVYQLDSMTRSVKIYSRLRQALSVPELKRVKIIGISVYLDQDNSISEVLVHVEAD